MENSSEKQIQIFLFDLSQLGLILSLSGACMGYTGINSIGVWLVFFAILGTLIREVVNRYITRPLLWVLVIIAYSFISIVFYGCLTYQAFVSLFSVIEIPVIMAFSKPLDTKRRMKSAAFFALATTIIYIAAYYSARSHLYMTIYGERTINDLTLGFSNPNETGMHLIATMYVLVSSIFLFEKILLKVVFSLASAVCIIFVFQTDSRACIIVCCLFLIFLIPVLKIKKISKAIQMFVLFSPFIILILSLIFQDFFSNIRWMNDELDTGRIAIYLERFRNLSGLQWIFGNYTYMFQNSLNAYLSVFVTAGIVPLIFFVKIIKYGFSVLDSCSENSFNVVAFLAIMLTIFHSSMESANLVSGGFYAASFYSIFIIGIDGSGHLRAQEGENFGKKIVDIQTYTH